MNPRILVFFLGLLQISSGRKVFEKKLKHNKMWVVVPDKFFAVLTAKDFQLNESCSPENDDYSGSKVIVFLKNNTRRENEWWPLVETKDGAHTLYLSKWHLKNKVVMKVPVNGTCNISVDATICKGQYNKNLCSNSALTKNDRYIVNTTAVPITCLNCNNPVKRPEQKVVIPTLPQPSENQDEEVSPSKAAEIMSTISDLANSINTSSVELTAGGEVLGVLVRKEDPDDIEEVSIGYEFPNSSINIVDNQESLRSFARSITVPKEAFEQSAKMNVTVPFAVVMRFNNLDMTGVQDTVLGGEVIAIEMGAEISNLTDYVSINFRNLTYEGIPSCQSWSGKENQTNWTDAGCQTNVDGDRITCKCSHMTFFAILLAPPNETISSHDLNNLTTITQVGCGVSMFFLCIVLFMHFFLRKIKPSKGTRILIHLVSAMFMLNLSFLVNSHVARLKNHVGCKILAAVMHYFLLATFSWFAVQAFHICLQLYTGGKIAIRRYMLKVSITSWALPSIAVITLLIIGKYGESLIYTSDSEENVAMCWITDSDAHYIINIGYYALVFLFTFTTFILMLSWLFCHKRMNTANAQTNSSGKTIGVVLGLCCLLGITWGFAFFAYGVFRIPAYYIFTILNSFQGFFLFIFYYNTSRSGKINTSKMGHDDITTTSTSATTLKTGLDYFENPYGNLPGKQ